MGGVKFEKENELFIRAVGGDAAAREQLILDSMHIAKQCAYTHMRGKSMNDDDKADELQAAYELLIVCIDKMIARGEMYNVKYLRNFLRLRLISYHREKVYGLDDGKMKRRDMDSMYRVRNAFSFDDCGGYEVEDDFDLDTYIDNKLMVDRLLSSLNDDELEIVTLMFYDRLTQQEVGQRLGISQTLVSFKYKDIINKLKKLGCDYYGG